jgi:PIN domain nuclease of toxin-antitoxin system
VFLLDTNVLIWFVTGDRRLSSRVRWRLEARGRRNLAISVLSIWEFGFAVERRRVKIKRRFDEIRNDLLSFGVMEHPVTSPIVMDALALDNLPNDPIDRLIVATARTLGGTLVTSDEKILGWPGDLARLDARQG